MRKVFSSNSSRAKWLLRNAIGSFRELQMPPSEDDGRAAWVRTSLEPTIKVCSVVCYSVQKSILIDSLVPRDGTIVKLPLHLNLQRRRAARSEPRP